MIEIIPVSFTCHSEKNDDVLVQCAPRTKTFAKLAPCICHLPLSYREVIELAGTASQCVCAVVTLFMGIHDQISTYPREGADDRLRYGYYRSPICWANESHWGYLEKCGWRVTYRAEMTHQSPPQHAWWLMKAGNLEIIEQFEDSSTNWKVSLPDSSTCLRVLLSSTFWPCKFEEGGT